MDRLKEYLCITCLVGGIVLLSAYSRALSSKTANIQSRLERYLPAGKGGDVEYAKDDANSENLGKRNSFRSI